jgi:hypothetical protein
MKSKIKNKLSKLHPRTHLGKLFVSLGLLLSCSQTTFAVTLSKTFSPAFGPSFSSSQNGVVDYTYTFIGNSWGSVGGCLRADGSLHAKTTEEETVAGNATKNRGVAEAYWAEILGECSPGNPITYSVQECHQEMNGLPTTTYSPAANVGNCIYEDGAFYESVNPFAMCDIKWEFFEGPGWTVIYGHPENPPCAPYLQANTCFCEGGGGFFGLATGWSAFYSLSIHIDAGATAPSLASLGIPLPPPITSRIDGESGNSGLVGWWRAENNANDALGVNNGTLQNGTTFASGKVGQAFSFDGVNDYVEVADSPSLRLQSELTIEFWYKRNTPFDSDYIINKGGDWSGNSTLNYGVAFAPPQYNNTFHFLFKGGIRNSISVTDTAWHHYAVTARHGDANPTFYVDGVQQAMTLSQGAATINLYSNTKPLYIGAQIDPLANYYNKGLLDELSLYNRVLSAAEIQSIYSAGSAGKYSP